MALTAQGEDALKAVAADVRRAVARGYVTVVGDNSNPIARAWSKATLAGFGRIDDARQQPGAAAQGLQWRGRRRGEDGAVLRDAGRALHHHRTNLQGVWYMSKAAAPLHELKPQVQASSAVSRPARATVARATKSMGRARRRSGDDAGLGAELKGTDVDTNIILPGGASDLVHQTGRGAGRGRRACGGRAAAAGRRDRAAGGSWLCTATNGVTERARDRQELGQVGRDRRRGVREVPRSARQKCRIM